MNNNVNGVQQSAGNSFIDNVPKDKNSIIGYVGALLVIIANFLPFVVVSAELYGKKIYSSSFSYASTGAGKLVLVCAIATIVLIALKKHAFTAGTAGLSALVFLYNLFTLKSKFSSSYTYSYGTIKVSWGAGIFLTLIGLVAVGVSIFLFWKENPNCFKDAMSSVKGGNKGAAQPMAQPQQPVQPQPMMQPQQPVQPQPMVQPQQPVQPTQNDNINNNMM